MLPLEVAAVADDAVPELELPLTDADREPDPDDELEADPRAAGDPQPHARARTTVTEERFMKHLARAETLHRSGGAVIPGLGTEGRDSRATCERR